MKEGTLVRVRIWDDGSEEAAKRHLMYGGWFGMVIRVNPFNGHLFVASNEYTRQTGKIQAVSFKEWFVPNELEEQST